MLINYKKRKPLITHDFRPNGADCLIEYKGIRYDNYFAELPQHSYRRAKTFAFVVKSHGMEVNIPYVRSRPSAWRSGSYVTVNQLTTYLERMATLSLADFTENEIMDELGRTPDYSPFKKIQWEIVKDVGVAWRILHHNMPNTNNMLNFLMGLPPRVWYGNLCGYSLADLMYDSGYCREAVNNG